MVLQQRGLFETNSRLQKLPSTFLFSHSFIPCSFSFLLLSHFFPKMSCCAGWRIHAFRPSASTLSRLHFPLFRDLQTTLRLLRYAYLLLDSHIIPSFVLHILHWNVLIYTIWRAMPYVFSGTLVTLFWSSSDRFPHLAISWNLFRGLSGWKVHKISNS